jgi:membrane-associated phospholipid phosphatase
VRRLAPARPGLAVAGGVLTALTATLVALGALTFVDQFAVDHLMPWLEVRRHPFVTFGALTIPSIDPPAAHTAVELWTYPAAVVPSLLLVLVAASRLARPSALAWCALWCTGNAVELVGKLSLDRPALYHEHAHVAAFDSSLPSGHTIRSLVIAGALATAWRSGRAAYVWAATVPAALVVSGAHTPSDVVAGFFVAVTLAGWAPKVRGS